MIDGIQHHSGLTNSGKQSFTTRLDPRMKLAVYLFFLGSVTLSDVINGYILGFYLLVFLLVSVLSADRFSLLTRHVFRLYPMILMVTLLLPFQNPGSPHNANGDSILQIFSLSIYKSGLLQFIRINIKFLLIIWLTRLLLLSMNWQQFFAALKFFRTPMWMESVLYYSYHFVALLKKEMNRLLLAYRSRYVYLPWNIRLKHMSHLAVHFFIRVIEQNERIYAAMISRGFSGIVHVQYALQWKISDTVLVVLTLSITMHIAAVSL
ncbi:MAG: hypothetical protein GF313_09350 [Caldithrix sp.]|nr:hypothetical protein [Caldithrix sp.]